LRLIESGMSFLTFKNDPPLDKDNGLADNIGGVPERNTLAGEEDRMEAAVDMAEGAEKGVAQGHV